MASLYIPFELDVIEIPSVCVVRYELIHREVSKRYNLIDWSLRDQYPPRRLSHRQDVVHARTRLPFFHQHIDVHQHLYVAGVDLCLYERRDRGGDSPRATHRSLPPPATERRLALLYSLLAR
jgi:hypothetical protein